MRRAVTLAILAIALAGCARERAIEPSYLGLGDAQASEDEEETGGGVEPALRRIPSNKVLGAMAFQKVTGRAVDPSRLSNGR